MNVVDTFLAQAHAFNRLACVVAKHHFDHFPMPGDGCAGDACSVCGLRVKRQRVDRRTKYVFATKSEKSFGLWTDDLMKVLAKECAVDAPPRF